VVAFTLLTESFGTLVCVFIPLSLRFPSTRAVLKPSSALEGAGPGGVVIEAEIVGVVESTCIAFK
jgi:hypothetical protein